MTARGVVAIAAGFFETAVTATVVDAVMHSTGVFPPFGTQMSGGLFLFALAYRTVFTVIGGFLTARLAPERSWRHVQILAVLGVIGGSLGIVAWFAGGPEMGPAWYPIALLVLAAPSVLLGGFLGQSGPSPITRIA